MKITLRTARVSAGYSIEKAAKEMGMSYMTLWKAETGKTKMSVSRFEKFCKLYGVNPKDIKVHPCEKLIAEV